MEIEVYEYRMKRTENDLNFTKRVSSRLTGLAVDAGVPGRTKTAVAGRSVGQDGHAVVFDCTRCAVSASTTIVTRIGSIYSCVLRSL